MIAALLNYFAAVATDGDYLNDWLTWLPTNAQPAIELIGRLLATLLGV